MSDHFMKSNITGMADTMQLPQTKRPVFLLCRVVPSPRAQRSHSWINLLQIFEVAHPQLITCSTMANQNRFAHPLSIEPHAGGVPFKPQFKSIYQPTHIPKCLLCSINDQNITNGLRQSHNITSTRSCTHPTHPHNRTLFCLSIRYMRLK